MRTRDPKTARLATVPAFAGLPARTLARIATLVEEVERPAGTVLLRQDGYADEAFVVIDGTVAVERGGEELALLGAGAVVGEVALLRGARRNAAVTARTPVRLLALQTRDFDRLCRTLPDVADRLRRDASQRSAGAAAAA